MEKKDSNLTERAVQGAFWSSFANFLNRFGALIFTIILARFLLPEKFGLFTLVMSIAMILITLADLGINEALLRFASSTNDKKKITSYFKYILRIKVALALMAAIGLVLASYPLSQFIFKKPELFLPLLASTLFVFTSLFVFFLSFLFYSIRKTKYIGFQEIIFQISRIVLVYLVFVLFSGDSIVIWTILALAVCNALVLFFITSWLKKEAGFLFSKSSAPIDRIEVRSFLGYSTIYNTAALFLTYLDAIVLGIFVSLSFVGYYRIAFTLIFGVISLFTQLCLVLMPIFTGIGNKRLTTALNKSARFIMIFAIPCAFGILVLGRYFIRLLYGADYLPASLPLTILSPLIIIWIPTALLITLFFSRGKPAQVAKINFLVLIINIILYLAFIPLLLRFSESLAIAGAAFSALISRFLLFSFMLSASKKQLKISLNKSIFVKPIIASSVMALSLFLTNRFLITDMTPLLGALEIISAALIYFLALCLLGGINKEDMLVLKKVKSILH